MEAMWCIVAISCGAEILKNWPARGIIPFDLSIIIYKLRAAAGFMCLPG